MSSSAPEYCIDIYEVSKIFKKSTRVKGGAYTTLKSAFLGKFKKTKEAQDNLKTAIKDLTIRIPKGASVGIIGRNGSGKSTLLKLITGIYKPSTGYINVNGRVAALIELGAGFHPDFTGRENLQLGAALQGLSKQEFKKIFDRIIEFAELEAVIDQPVKTYSSGMFMRLGFSLAVHTDPDILLIDEVLAVGDAGFVAKCKERISELRKSGKSLLLVSHDLDAVERWCDEAIWLRDGEVADRGDPRRVIDHYRQFIEKGEEAELEQINIQHETTDERQTERWGSREIEITAVRLVNTNNEEHLLFHSSDKLTLEVDYLVHTEIKDLVFGVGIARNDGLQIFGTNTSIEKIKLNNINKQGKIKFVIERLGLLSGRYNLDVAVHREDGYPYDYHKNILEFAVRSDFNQVGVIEPEHTWMIEELNTVTAGVAK